MIGNIRKIALILSASLFAMSSSFLNAAPKVPSAKEIMADQEKKYAAEMVKMKKRDAAKDAESAQSLGFPYLLAHHAGRSTTMIVPGLNPRDSLIAQNRCPILILDGLGDTVYGPNHLAYRKAMVDYATKFNKINYRACMGLAR